MAVFNFCLVADDVRLEIDNKASVIGLYGILPHVGITVRQPELPIYKLTFLFVSGAPVSAGTYRTRLSVLGPQGRELMQSDDVVTSEIIAAGMLNVALHCLPFPLSGPGTYQITAIVNDVADFSSTLQVDLSH